MVDLGQKKVEVIPPFFMSRHFLLCGIILPKNKQIIGFQHINYLTGSSSKKLNSPVYSCYL